MANLIHINTLTCYASGIRVSRGNGEPLSDAEQKDFFRRNRLSRYFPEQCTDMKHFFFSVAVVILSTDGKKIVKLRHKEATHVRFETCNPATGKIEHLFYANREDCTPEDGEIEVIPVLDIQDPVGDLETLTEKNSPPPLKTGNSP